MKWMLLAPLALLIAMPAMAQTAPVTGQDVGGTGSNTPITRIPSQEGEILSSMWDSAEGWNHGDIDRFLAIYSDDPNTSFTGSSGVERGKAGIRARYLVSYHDQFAGTASAPPTTLSFTYEDFRMIGDDYALLIARWKLVKFNDEAGAKSGMTSLLFHREPGGWKIMADHSS